ncbi:MAG: hypothetical protein ACI8QS_002968 [Planctomycetota bacterium]|jgi:hypothetical protein
MGAKPSQSPEAYFRREPTSGVLYELLAAHLETFLARSQDDPCKAPLPSYVVRELTGYLQCGILAYGFSRFRCDRCGTDDLLAFSCKGRGFCPSCGGRRMAESAAHLVDHVLPQVPIRQWVISFPWALRYLLARRPHLLSQVRRIFLRAVFGFYKHQSRLAGLHRGRTGAVSRVQRFGSSLNLNPHLQPLVLDGVYCATSPYSRPVFHDASDVTQEDVEQLVRTIHARVLRHLERQGFLVDDGTITTSQDEVQESLLPLFQAASIRGQSLQGSEAVERVFRLVPSNQRFRPPNLCAEFDGFSLHAATRIPAHDRATLEHLCRYIGRPPFSSQSLTLDSTGRVLFQLRRPWRDGTTQLRFDPLTFLSRLASLVPPPRVHQQTYHGLLAPGDPWRNEVVPAKRLTTRAAVNPPEPLPKPKRPQHRYLMAQLMRRVFGFEVLRCSVCRRQRRLIAVILDRSAIVRILSHLGFECDPPPIQPARAPPQSEFAF